MYSILKPNFKYLFFNFLLLAKFSLPAQARKLKNEKKIFLEKIGFKIALL
jgi:hypothetical protein